MGNFKFRFSDMMPNTWFYKLKDMGRRRSRNQKTSTYSMRKKQLASTATTAPQPPKSKQPHHLSHSRKSYYFTRDPISSFDSFYKSPNSPKSHFPDPPRKSSKQTAPKKKSTKSSPKLVTSSVSAGCNCRSTFESVRGANSDFSPEYPVSPLDSSPEKDLRLSPLPELSSDEALAIHSFDTMVALSSSCDCKDNSDCKDIILELDKERATRQFEKRDLFHSVAPEVELAPILTKPAKFTVTEINPKENKEQAKHCKSTTKSEEGNARRSLSVKASKELTKATALKEQRRTDPVRRVSANSPGMRLRVKSPRIASITQGGRRSVSSSSSSSSRRSVTDSFAVVKSSFDPQKDFKESMLEMIVENNIRASKDLEELLACYLSLNSDEYHDLIIKVFKQIWFDLSDIQRKK